MKIKETRIMHRSDLRLLCIKHDWYTSGDNAEYSKLLDMTASRMTTNKLIQIAEDIKSHSDTPYEITDIMHELSQICFSYFEEV